VAGGDLDIAQVDPGVEHGRDERMPEHMGMKLGDPDSRCLGEPSEPPGGCMPVHPRAVAVEQDRPGGAVAHGAVDGPADRRRQRDQDDLAAFTADAQDPVAVFLAEVADVRAGGLMIRRPSRPSMATTAKSYGLADWRAAVSRASNCRCVNPRADDSAGTAGRRTYSAGECSRTPSMTQVR
jgi:hypothetical protein